MMPYVPHEDPVEESKHGCDSPHKKLPLDPKYNPFEPYAKRQSLRLFS